MNLDDIIKDSIPIWKECMELPFIVEFMKGTLKKDKMTKYIVEDTTYLTEYAKCFAYCITKCRTLAEIRFFYDILGFANENETSVRRVYLEQEHIDEEWAETRTPDPINKKYLDHLLKYTKEGSLLEGVMAVLPCMLSYEYIFMNLKEKYPLTDANPYKEILRGYLDPAYTKKCAIWIEFTNSLLAKSNEDTKHLLEIFRESSIRELDFWRMSYEKSL